MPALIKSNPNKPLLASLSLAHSTLQWCSRIAVLAVLLGSCFYSKAQNIAPKKHYLVDSLDLSTIAKRDSGLVDSMLTIYHDCANDTCRINAVSVIVEESWDEAVWPKYNQWVHDFVQERLPSAKKEEVRRHLQKSLAGAVNNIGYLHNSRGEIDQALHFYSKSLVIQKEINDKHGMAGSLINIGHIYHNQGLIARAIENYYGSLQLEEELNNPKGIALALNGIGYIHFIQGENEKAFLSYTRSLAIREELKDDYGIATCYNNLGLLFKDQEEWDKALSYYQKGLAIENRMADETGIAISLGNIGLVYAKTGAYDKALDFAFRSLEIKKKLNDRDGISHQLNQIASIRLSQGKLKEARHFAQQSLWISQQLQFPANLRNVAETLSKIAQKEKNWKEAFKFEQLYIQMRDSINNKETKTSTIRQQVKYKYEKEALADSIRNVNAQRIKDAELIAAKAENEQSKAVALRQRQRSIFLFFGLGIVLLFSGFMYSRFKVISRQKALIEVQKAEVERQNAEREDHINYIEEQREKLILLNQELKQFAYVVSHDLKTPMRGIANLVRMVEEDHPNIGEDLHILFQLIQERSIKMHNLIDGILDYTKAGKQEMDIEPVDVKDLLEEVIREADNSKEITFELASDLPTIVCNKIQMEQIVSNLIDNAIKYNHQPLKEGKITIGYSKTPEFHEFSVADNGPGIAPLMHGKIFDLFKKAHYNPVFDSTGIGLSIVRKLVNQNGGAVTLDSEEGQGSKFIFTWPTKDPAPRTKRSRNPVSESDLES